MNIAREHRRIQRALARHIDERRRFNLERRRIRDASNPFDYGNDIFIKYFRASKDVATYLSNSLSGELKKKRADGLNVTLQVLVALRFLAEGGYQRGVGQDLFLAVSQPTVCRCVKNVTRAICNRLYNVWVKMPLNDQEKNDIQLRFRALAGFPGVLGAIDCTHVAIVTPLEGEEGYKNHKGFYSLNVQMICDDSLKIMDVCVYPGTVHDQFIWRWSRARTQLRLAEENRLGRFFLLGDAGYALEPWLLTPLANALPGTPDYEYTQAHCRARNVVERLFGVMKARWRCLLRDRVLHYQPQQATSIITACAVLHNILLHYRLPDPEINVEEAHINDMLQGPIPGDNLVQARAIQRRIINLYFT